MQREEIEARLDAYFDPETTGAIRQAAAVVAARHDLPEDLLNDAVKGFFSTVPRTSLWAEYPGLRVNTVTPAYMFAMKAIAGRPAGDRLGEHVSDRLLTARTRYIVEELFEVDT